MCMVKFKSVPETHRLRFLSYMNNFVKVPKPSYNISSIKLEVLYKAQFCFCQKNYKRNTAEMHGCHMPVTFLCQQQ